MAHFDAKRSTIAPVSPQKLKVINALYQAMKTDDPKDWDAYVRLKGQNWDDGQTGTDGTAGIRKN